ncbi:MAG: hypothetical protein HN705_06395, partial [Rhodospirillales bacterium]|nr:hypothetical protein [Rhodospirillales bacterium]
MSDTSSGVEFVGCELTYHADKPAFDRNPTSLESHTHRPLIINGKRMLAIDVHAHCQIIDAWPLVQGQPEMEGHAP